MAAAPLTNVSPTNILNALYAKQPTEGPRYLPSTFDFTEYVTWVVDYTLVTQNHQVSSIQALYIDNSNNSAAVTFSTSGGQIITIPAGAQAYMPIILNDTPRFNVTSTGTKCIILALNFAVLPCVWQS